MNFLRKIGLI